MMNFSPFYSNFSFFSSPQITTRLDHIASGGAETTLSQAFEDALKLLPQLSTLSSTGKIKGLDISLIPQIDPGGYEHVCK